MTSTRAFNANSPRQGDALTRSSLSKVPEITALFWIIKILTTGMGETTSDFLTHRFPPPVAVACGFLVFCLALVVQFRARRYISWIYWAAVVMVSVFGTMAADVLHVGFGVPYIASTLFFALTLASVFALWLRTEKTLSIHSITTCRREIFYWLTVLATFALGTAAGDLTANTLGLGWFPSAILFTIAFAIPAGAYLLFRSNATLSFWTAYVITRPVGASFADWMGLPHSRGGLGYGTGPISFTLFVAIIALVAFISRPKATSSIPVDQI